MILILWFWLVPLWLVPSEPEQPSSIAKEIGGAIAFIAILVYLSIDDARDRHDDQRRRRERQLQDEKRPLKLLQSDPILKTHREKKPITPIRRSPRR